MLGHWGRKGVLGHWGRKGVLERWGRKGVLGRRGRKGVSGFILLTGHPLTGHPPGTPGKRDYGWVPG